MAQTLFPVSDQGDPAFNAASGNAHCILAFSAGWVRHWNLRRALEHCHGIWAQGVCTACCSIRCYPSEQTSRTTRGAEYVTPPGTPVSNPHIQPRPTAQAPCLNLEMALGHVRRCPGTSLFLANVLSCKPPCSQQALSLYPRGSHGSRPTPQPGTRRPRLDPRCCPIPTNTTFNSSRVVLHRVRNNHHHHRWPSWS